MPPLVASRNIKAENIYIVQSMGKQLSFFHLERPNKGALVYAVRHQQPFTSEELEALEWLFDGATSTTSATLQGRYFVGPRPELITPWSTTATEITFNMGVGKRAGIDRIEFYEEVPEGTPYDHMLLCKYHGIAENIFQLTSAQPEAVLQITDLRTYNEVEGLALSDEEIVYLEEVARELGRPLTDSELFGFSQVNSEHCRHKIFGGTFVVDGEEQGVSLLNSLSEPPPAPRTTHLGIQG